MSYLTLPEQNTSITTTKNITKITTKTQKKYNFNYRKIQKPILTFRFIKQSLMSFNNPSGQ